MKNKLSKQDIEQLNKYASLCNDELGEMLKTLIDIYINSELLFLQNTKKAIEKELLEQLKYFGKNTKIILKKDYSTRTYECLEWNQEEGNDE